MDFVLTLGSAATATSLVVSLFKFAYPVAPSWAIALVSVLSGIGLALLVSLAQGDVLSAQTAATSVVAGIFAAASAAGITRTDQSAEQKRLLAKEQEYTR